jgi:hypothetical protein
VFVVEQNWKHIKINGVVKINKCVAKFKIWELYYSPYAQFKVKVFEDAEGHLTGVSNLQVKNQSGNVEYVTGQGATIEEALTDTLQCFFRLVSWKGAREWGEEDYVYEYPFDL